MASIMQWLEKTGYFPSTWREGAVVVAASALGLDLLGRAGRALLYRAFPEEIARQKSKLSAQERIFFDRDFRLYIGAAVHAAVVVYMSFASMYTMVEMLRGREVNAGKSFWQWFWDPEMLDHSRADREERMDKNRYNHQMLYFMMGYILQDSFGLIGRIQGQKATVMHHVTTFFLCYWFSMRQDELAMCIPAITHIEGSTVFLDSAWVLKRLGLDRAHRYSMLLFAASFFLLRIVSFPIQIAWIHIVAPSLVDYDASTFGVYFIVLLQFYWFRLIVKKVRRG